VSNTPVIQYMSLYGKQNNQEVEVLTNDNGDIVNDEAITTLYLSATAGDSATLISKRSTHYRPGQGVSVRFTAEFWGGTLGSIQYAGIGTEANGLFFGYDGERFGICHRYNGKKIIVILEITSAFSSAALVTVTLEDVDYTFTSANASGSLSYTAHQFEQANYGGLWEVEHVGNYVYFISKYCDVSTGTIDVNFNTSGGNGNVNVFDGRLHTEDWIYQEDWNYDKMDGTGRSEYTLEPNNGIHVYQIQFGYLGVANPKFFVMDSEYGEFRLVHVINSVGNSNPLFTNPHMRMYYDIRSETSTEIMEMKMVSFYAASEGPIVRFEPRFAVDSLAKTLATGVERVLITLKNSIIYNDRNNQGEIFLTFLSIATEGGNRPVTVRIYRNLILSPVPTVNDYTNYQYVDEDNSIALVDIIGDTFTPATNKLLFTFNLLNNESRTINLTELSVILTRGDTITITGFSLSTSATNVACSLSFIEDH